VVAVADSDNRRKSASLNGISVYTLLHLGMSPYTKRQIFKLFLDFPTWKLVDTSNGDKVSTADLFSWDLFISMSPIDSLVDTQELAKISMTYMNIASKRTPSAKSISETEKAKSHFGSSTIVIKSLLGEVGPLVESRRDKILWRTLRKEFDEHRADMANGRYSTVYAVQ
jgi:hypothetical protein